MESNTVMTRRLLPESHDAWFKYTPTAAIPGNKSTVVQNPILKLIHKLSHNNVANAAKGADRSMYVPTLVTLAQIRRRFCASAVAVKTIRVPRVHQVYVRFNFLKALRKHLPVCQHSKPVF